MKRIYLISSLLLLTSYLVAQEADHVWLHKVRNHILKNYTFQNFKEIEDKYLSYNAVEMQNGLALVGTVYINFLKDLQQNELLQRFRNALHSDDPEKSRAAYQMLTTIQSDLRRRLDWLERHHNLYDKRGTNYIEKCLFSLGTSLFLCIAGLCLNNPEFGVTGLCFGYIGCMTYLIVHTKTFRRSLVYKTCYETLREISSFLDEVACSQEVKKNNN